MTDSPHTDSLLVFAKILRQQIRGMQHLASVHERNPMTTDPVCFFCGNRPACRWVNFNKPDNSTGRLRACEECRFYLKTRRDEEGAWTLDYVIEAD